jgi:hypothetical protein
MASVDKSSSMISSLSPIVADSLLTGPQVDYEFDELNVLLQRVKNRIHGITIVSLLPLFLDNSFITVKTDVETLAKICAFFARISPYAGEGQVTPVDSRVITLGICTRPSNPRPRPRRWPSCPRRDRDETLVGLETVLRRRDRDVLTDTISVGQKLSGD